MNLSVPLTVCTYTYSLIWLHPDTFEPEHLFPQPATHVLSTTLRSCLAPQSLLLLYTHPHENQGSWTPTSRGSVITEWIDCVCVCVKCERRLCGFNSLCLAYKFTSTQYCLSLVWQEEMTEGACVCVLVENHGEGERNIWQMGNKKRSI